MIRQPTSIGTNGGTKKQQMALDMMDEAREEADNPQLGYHAITTQFKENTTAHGIPHVYHANGKCKVTFWTIISLIALAGLIWNGYTLVAKYIAFDVSTSVSIESDRSLAFPAVTLCNHNPIKKMEMAKDAELLALIQGSGIGRKKRDVADYETLAANRVRRRTSHPESNTALAANRVKRQTPGSSTVPGKKDGQTTNARFQLLQSISDTVADMSIAEKTSLGYSLDSMVLDCEFNGYDCNMTSDFEQYWDASFGNCYTYNWDKVETSYKPGASHGLAITFNVDQDQYVGDMAEAAGMRVVVHHQDNMPFPSDEGISITPGQLSFVGIKKTEITRLGQQYGTCYKKVDPSDFTINVYAEIFGVQYTSKACYVTCFQRHVIDECGCGDGSFPLYGVAFGYKNVSACKSSDATQVACEDEIFTKYNDGTLACDCPESCDQIGYEYAMSSVLWPTDAYLPSVISEYISNPSVKHLFMNDSDDYTTNMGKFVVYFEEFNYQSITESPAYTFGSLISDMGGILGLYLGFSALTILEFFELIGDLMVWGVIACCKKKKNRSNTPIEPIKQMPEYYNKGLTGMAS